MQSAKQIQRDKNMDLQLAQEKDAVLGQDFLTWLWFKSEAQNHVFKTSEDEDFAIYIGQRIVVEGGVGESLEKAVCTGMMSRLQEAKQGLRSGKKVVQAKVTMEEDSNSWSMQLDASMFSFNGLKTPKMDTQAQDGDEPDGIFLEKMYLLERAMYFTDELYREFLGLRLSPEWIQECRRIREWMQQD